MDWLRRNPLVAALSVAAAALALIVAVELWSGLRPAPDPQPPRAAAAADAKLLPPLALAPAEQAYPEVAARPLWVPTRRPAPQAAVAGAPAFKRDQFVLQGVTIAGNTRIALLRDKASGKVHRVASGDEVNGLKLVEVKPEAVTLAQGDDRETLQLLVQKPPAATVGAAPGTGPFAASQAPTGMAAPGAGMPFPQPSGTAGGPVPVPAQPGNAPMPANPTPAPVPQQSAQPMTAEELLARRRARRNQPTP